MWGYIQDLADDLECPIAPILVLDISGLCVHVTIPHDFIIKSLASRSAMAFCSSGQHDTTVAMGPVWLAHSISVFMQCYCKLLRWLAREFSLPQGLTIFYHKSTDQLIAIISPIDSAVMKIK